MFNTNANKMFELSMSIIHTKFVLINLYVNRNKKRFNACMYIFFLNIESNVDSN